MKKILNHIRLLNSSRKISLDDQFLTSLKDHSFKFKPINKSSNFKTPSLKDKIVLDSMQIILNELYGSKFSNTNYHNCLYQIKYGWQGTKWFIQGNINDYFNSINYEILQNIMMEDIKDREFIDLFWKAVNIGYINFPNIKWEKGLNTPPKLDKLSLLLSNIYLHKLDLFLENKIEESKKTGNTSLECPKYKKINSDISNLKAYFRDPYKRTLSDEEVAFRIKKIKTLEKERACLSSKIQGPGYRIKYIRYADDFLIGVNGKEDICIKLKEDLKKFLLKELKLTLKEDKIINARKNRALFLNVNIKVNHSPTHDQPRSIHGKGSSKVVKRYSIGNIQLLAPLQILVNKLNDQGICNIIDFRNRKIIPTRKTAWCNLSLIDIVKRYSGLWIRILNYYSFVDNRSQLNLIQFLLHHSCACTIADKMKLGSRAKVFKRFGKKLEVEVGVKFPLKKNLSKIGFKKTYKWNAYPWNIFNWKTCCKINHKIGRAHV